MPQPFFPHSVGLAWAFYVVLVGITLIATYTDLRYLQIPKWLTMPTIVLGVLVNVVLGAWIGADGARGSFLVGGDGGWMGALDGLLLSVCGFLTGFGLFLVMYVVGSCRGGDVKLFAGIGAWVGPMLCIYLLAGTIFAVVLMGFGRLVWKFFTHGFGKTFRNYTLKAGRPAKRTGKKGTEEPKTTRRRLTAYSPAVALSVALLLLWFFKSDLNLGTPKPAKNTETAQTARR